MTWLSGLAMGTDRLIGASGWKTVSQARIDQFAQATDDFQFIHVDPERADREAPFGGTIAHGFLTLSLLSALASDVVPRSDALKSVMIVAIDRVKFISPLRAGKRVRGVFTLERSSQLAQDRLLLKIHAAVEIDDEVKPALTCDVSWVAVLNESCDRPVHQSIAVADAVGQSA